MNNNHETFAHGSSGSAITAQQLNRCLMEALAFDEHDLMANRQGNLTPHQTIGLRRLENHRKSMLVLILIIFVLGMACSFFVDAPVRLGSTENPACIIPAVIVYGMLLSMLVASILNKNIHDKSYTLSHCEGMVTIKAEKRMAGRGVNTYHTIRIQALKFDVKPAIMQAFKNQTRYRIFYTRLDEEELHIVSAEALPPESTSSPSHNNQ